MAVASAALDENFGGNLRYPSSVRGYAPRDEAELMRLLREHPDGSIRVVGRLHSWSDVIQADGLVIDLRHFNRVELRRDGDRIWAEVGAGCQIKRLLAVLRAQGYTPMSQGLITEQALAGAAGTGTHGSGKSSLSHYIDGVRLIRFTDPAGNPVIEEVSAGDGLRAARCGLGVQGLVTRVTIPVRPAYRVEEHFREYATLPEVLAREADYPLQQFYFVPWLWTFHAQHRREVAQSASWSWPLYRLFWSLGMDRMMHWVLMGLARKNSAAWTRTFFRHVLPWLVPKGWKVVDRSDRQLSMGHHLYRHIETELFVVRDHLPQALEFVRLVLRHAAGDAVELGPAFSKLLDDPDRAADWRELRGSYVHHYPVCIRRILPDETLVSMASGDEPRYSISLISYEPPSRRAGFLRMSRFATRAAARLFGARPHWGKHCPLRPEEFASLYPHFDQFAAIRARSDPAGRLLNDWLRAVFQAME